MRAAAKVPYTELVDATDAARLTDKLFGGSDVLHAGMVTRTAPGCYELQATPSFRARMTQQDGQVVTLTLMDRYGFEWFRRRYLIRTIKRIPERRARAKPAGRKDVNLARPVRCITTGQIYDNRYAAARAEGCRPFEVYRCCAGYQHSTIGKKFEWDAPIPT